MLPAMQVASRAAAHALHNMFAHVMHARSLVGVSAAQLEVLPAVGLDHVELEARLSQLRLHPAHKRMQMQNLPKHTCGRTGCSDVRNA